MNAEWPGVSVVMPVLNEERHLQAAVRRVQEVTRVGPATLHDLAVEFFRVRDADSDPHCGPSTSSLNPFPSIWIMKIEVVAW